MFNFFKAKKKERPAAPPSAEVTAVPTNPSIETHTGAAQRVAERNAESQQVTVPTNQSVHGAPPSISNDDSDEVPTKQSMEAPYEFDPGPFLEDDMDEYQQAMRSYYRPF